MKNLFNDEQKEMDIYVPNGEPSSNQSCNNDNNPNSGSSQNGHDEVFHVPTTI